MVLELRSSERSTFKRCPQKWEWGIKEGLRPHRVANPLWFGTAVHVALAEWYKLGFKRGPMPSHTFQRILDSDRTLRVPSDDEEAEAEYISARELGVAMLENYVNHYKSDPNWDVLATEQTFEYWLPRRGSKRGRHTRYLGTFDGVYRDQTTGYIWLPEHKTAVSINTQHLPLDYQAGPYWLVAEFVLKKMGIIKPGEHIAGIMYNILRKQKPDERPKNAEGLATNKPVKEDYQEAFRDAGIPWHRWGELVSLTDHQLFAAKYKLKVLGKPSKIQPAPYFERYPVYRSVGERRTQFRRIQDDAWHIEKARNDPDFPIMKNPTKDCYWDCPFFQMCQLHDQGDLESVQDFKETMFTVGDPYEDHRKSA